MAAAKKSAQRSATKKRSPAKGRSKKKRPSSKKASGGATGLTRQAKKGIKAARGAWKTFKTTTAQVVEGVKDTLAGDDRPASKRPRSR